MPSVTCLRLSDVSVMCRVTYISSNSGLLFSMSVSQAAVLPQHSGVLGLPNIGRCRKFG